MIWPCAKSGSSRLSASSLLLAVGRVFGSWGGNKAVVKAPLGLDTTSSGSNGDMGTAWHAWYAGPDLGKFTQKLGAPIP